MGFLKRLKFWKRERNGGKAEVIRVLEERLKEEQTKNCEQEEYLFFKWWRANRECDQLRAEVETLKKDFDKLSKEKESAADLLHMARSNWLHAEKEIEKAEAKLETQQNDFAEQMSKEKSYADDLLQMTINTWACVNKQLARAEAEKEIIKKEFGKNLKEEKRKTQEAKNELAKIKAEKETLVKEFNEKLQNEKKKNYEEGQKVLKKLWEANKQLAEIKAQQQANRLQLAAGRMKSQQDVMDVAKCGGSHPLNDFIFKRVLGKGGFGTVMLAEPKTPGVPPHQEGSYAIKVLKKKDVIENGCVPSVMAEKRILQLLYGHPFVVSLYSCFQTKANLFFVMEFAHGGDLRNQLDLAGAFDEPTAAFYAAEITLALEFVHKKGVVHRDVKPENILLDKEGHIKISDFGLAKFGLFAVTRAQTFCGTRDYMAPEIALELPYRKNVDWWALGVTIYEMITGYRPFFQHDEYDVLDAIVNDGVWCPEWMSSEAWSIIDAFLTKDPSERLEDPQAIKRSEFFKHINWKDLEQKRVRPPVLPKTVETTEGQSNAGAIFTPVPPVSGREQDFFRCFSWKNC